MIMENELRTRGIIKTIAAAMLAGVVAISCAGSGKAVSVGAGGGKTAAFTGAVDTSAFFPMDEGMTLTYAVTYYGQDAFDVDITVKRVEKKTDGDAVVTIAVASESKGYGPPIAARFDHDVQIKGGIVAFDSFNFLKNIAMVVDAIPNVPQEYREEAMTIGLEVAALVGGIYLPLPPNLRPGDTFKDTIFEAAEYFEKRHVRNRKCAAVQYVTVPAGQFVAHRVTYDFKEIDDDRDEQGENYYDTQMEWHVKGIGLVKAVTIGSSGETMTVELKSITM